MKIAMMAMTISLALSSEGNAQPPPSPPPPSPAPILAHGLAYFEPGGERRIPPTGLDPIAYLAARTPSGAYAFVRAHTDTPGDAQANHDLSLRRARSVANELEAMGVNPYRIDLIACGEAVLVVPTSDNVAEPLNRVAEFDWARARPQAPDGCTLHPYREAAVVSLSRTEAEAMSTAELAQRLFPDLSPKAAFRSRVSSSSRFGGQGLTSVSVYTRPTDLGDGVCGAVRHSVTISRFSPDLAKATAATPVQLDQRNDSATHFMRPTSGPESAKPCAEHNPERFYGVRPISVQLDPPFPLTAAKLLRAAVLDGVEIPIECTDHTNSHACDTPGSALKAFEPDRVISISSGAGPGARCPGKDAAGCWEFTTDLYGPNCGAWIVVVSVRDNRLAGLRMQRSCIVFH